MKKNLFNTVGLITIISVALCISPVYAQENVKELKKQIEALQNRVEELESNQGQTQNKDSRDFLNRGRSNRWDPFSEMDRMQKEMSRMFHNSFNQRGWSNKGMFSNNLSFDHDFDLKETKEGYEIRFDMAGLDKEKVDIEINEYSITVKGEHSSQNTEEKPGQYFSAQSFRSFMKTIPLPVDADTTKMKTEKEGDSLIIRLPKKS